MIISKKFNELYNKFFKFLEGIKTKRETNYLFTEAHLKALLNKEAREQKKKDNFVRRFNKKKYNLNK